MQANPTRRHWPADRIPLQRAVMGLALEVYPHWRTIPELAREIGASGALTRAVIELVVLGLLESHGFRSTSHQARRLLRAAEPPMTITEQRGDRTTQRAVLSFLLAEFPACHTKTTLWWMGFGDIDALEEAIRMLERFGLIRQERRAVRLTDAARHFDWLELA